MIEEFKSVIAKRGLAKPTLFRIEIVNIPGSLLDIRGMSEILRDLHFFAETAEFPGTQILTQEIRYYDLTEKIAYGKAHDDLNITFRLDRDFQVKRFFDLWVNMIYNRETGNVNYKSHYAGTIQIYQVMQNGVSSYALQLEEAYPIQVGQISLGWDQAGTYSRLPVTFTFRRTQVIANKRIFRAPASTTSGTTSVNRNKTNQNLMNERTIQSLNENRYNISSLQNVNTNALRQIRIGNQLGLNNYFGGINFLN